MNVEFYIANHGGDLPYMQLRYAGANTQPAGSIFHVQGALNRSRAKRLNKPILRQCANANECDDPGPQCKRHEDSRLGIPRCANPGPTNLLRCGNCKRIWYCSERCQKNSWKYHKPFCRSPTVSVSIVDIQHKWGVASTREDNSPIMVDRYIYEESGISKLPPWYNFVDLTKGTPMAVSMAMKLCIPSSIKNNVLKVKRDIIFLQWRGGSPAGKHNLMNQRRAANAMVETQRQLEIMEQSNDEPVEDGPNTSG